MSNDPAPVRAAADAALEREIRDERKYSLAKAIGRLAGPGMLKGVSPVSSKQQAEAAIESYLNGNFRTGDGALSIVLFGRVKESELLLANLEQPLVVLAAYVEQILQSDYLLQDLVRAADVEWGRIYQERPHFEKAGAPPHPDDPYTQESVRSCLTNLYQALTALSHPS